MSVNPVYMGFFKFSYIGIMYVHVPTNIYCIVVVNSSSSVGSSSSSSSIGSSSSSSSSSSSK